MIGTISSLIKCKCPKCHKGNLFLYSNPYNLKRVVEMPERCSCCGQRTEPEPGFYYGAMYCSYMLCVAIFVINFFLFGVWLDLSPLNFILIYTSQLIALLPFIFRYARVMYIYIFIGYDKDAIYKYPNKPAKLN